MSKKDWKEVLKWGMYLFLFGLPYVVVASYLSVLINKYL